VRTINEDANGNIWVGTNNGFDLLSKNGNDFIHYKHSDADINTLNSNCIYSADLDKNGELWIGTEEGLNIFNTITGKNQRINSDFRNLYGLQGKSVRSIFIDKSGIYWVATYQGGVNKYDKNLTLFNLRTSNPLDPKGLSSPFVTSFAESPTGDIYIGTDGGGLNLFNRVTGLIDHPKLTDGPKDQKMPILAMEKVGNELWIGTYQQGLFVLDMLTKKVKQFLKGKNGLNSNEIFCIRKDSRGNIWIENSISNQVVGFLNRRNLPRLTPREYEIVALICRGMKNKQIADALSITIGTVKVHLMHIFEKTGVKDRFELALEAHKLIGMGNTEESESLQVTR